MRITDVPPSWVSLTVGWAAHLPAAKNHAAIAITDRSSARNACFVMSDLMLETGG
jgi:hypothetical protein